MADEGNGGSVEYDTAGWRELVDVQSLRPRDGEVPFRLWANRVKSSSPDSELLIHDPLASMIGNVEGVTPETRVTTMVANHHKTLAFRHLFALAVVAANPGHVFLVLYKMPPEG